MSFDQRLYGFLFDPAAGVQMSLVQSLFSDSEQAMFTSSGANEVQLRKLAAQKISQGSQVKEIDLGQFNQSVIDKLPLLSPEEWRLLGLGVALLPFVGRIARSMDGNFRRSIRTALKETDIEALDALANEPELASTKPVFQAPSMVWKNLEIVQAGGVAATLSELCHWPQSVANRTLWKLKFSEQQVGPIVTGLQPQHIEVLCKTLLPNHPWLLSSSQTH